MGRAETAGIGTGVKPLIRLQPAMQGFAVSWHDS